LGAAEPLRERERLLGHWRTLKGWARGNANCRHGHGVNRAGDSVDEGLKVMGKQLEQSVTEIESGTRGDADTDRERPKLGSVQGALPFELTSARHGFPGQSERMRGLDLVSQSTGGTNVLLRHLLSH
jgi:hypothetical protein